MSILACITEVAMYWCSSFITCLFPCDLWFSVLAVRYRVLCLYYPFCLCAYSIMYHWSSHVVLYLSLVTYCFLCRQPVFVFAILSFFASVSILTCITEVALYCCFIIFFLITYIFHLTLIALGLGNSLSRFLIILSFLPLCLFERASQKWVCIVGLFPLLLLLNFFFFVTRCYCFCVSTSELLDCNILSLFASERVSVGFMFLFAFYFVHISVRLSPKNFPFLPQLEYSEVFNEMTFNLCHICFICTYILLWFGAPRLL